MIESLFRRLDCDSHVIAKKFVPDTNDKLSLIRPSFCGDEDIPELMYQVFISCRPKKLALEELLDSWSTYEENFEICWMRWNQRKESCK